MHLEILIEDQSGKAALEILLPKIFTEGVTHRVIPYKGIGRIPKNLNKFTDPSKRVLLNTLPKLIQGYGKTFASYAADYSVALIVVCDLDGRDLNSFISELEEIVNRTEPKPLTRFCLAIEEGEAWLLGDINAIKYAYPKSNSSVLNNYVNDSICGTWEVLADAVYPGGCKELKKKGWQAVGAEKSNWAKSICPLIDVSNNKSPSFNYFMRTILELAESSPP